MASDDKLEERVLQFMQTSGVMPGQGSPAATESVEEPLLLGSQFFSMELARRFQSNNGVRVSCHVVVAMIVLALITVFGFLIMLSSLRCLRCCAACLTCCCCSSY